MNKIYCSIEVVLFQTTLLPTRYCCFVCNLLLVITFLRTKPAHTHNYKNKLTLYIHTNWNAIIIYNIHKIQVSIADIYNIIIMYV